MLLEDAAAGTGSASATDENGEERSREATVELAALLSHQASLPPVPQSLPGIASEKHTQVLPKHQVAEQWHVIVAAYILV